MIDNAAPVRKYPLIATKNLDQIAKEEQTAADNLQQQKLEVVNENALAGHIRRAWEDNKLSKLVVERKLLANLRARRGVYGTDELAQLQAAGGVNVVWVDLTETKCRAGSAWIRDILMPPGERPWDLEPTPLPDIPPEIMDAIMQKAAQAAQGALEQAFQAGGGIMSKDEFVAMATDIQNQLTADAMKEAQKRAASACSRMADQIADNMDQGDWEESMDAFIEDLVTHPAAILKGPFYERRKQLKWDRGFKPVMSNEPRQVWKRVDPFDIYPAPLAKDCQTGNFIERVRFTRESLYDCIGLPDYDEDNIRNALREYSSGLLMHWLWSESERQRLQGETLWNWLSPHGVIDGLHFYGNVPGWKLIDWGIQLLEKGVDPVRDYEIDAILIGHYVIRAAINQDPLGRRPYMRACYDEIPGAFWGRSVPDLCRVPQQMCNAFACAMADNAGMASGPMVWVYNDRFADGQQIDGVAPWQIWQMKAPPDGTSAAQAPMGFFQANMNLAELSAAYDKWEARADDATGIPRYTYGNQNVGGAGDTASGLAMLLNSAAKGLRRAISNVDLNVMKQTVNSSFIHEMLFNPDHSIKCDAYVVARGAAAILIKESAQQRRIQALGMTANPIDIQIIGMTGRAKLLRETFKSMELGDDIVPSDEDMQAKEQQQAEQAAAQQQAAQQQVQAQQQAENDRAALAAASKTQEVQGRAQIAGATLAAKMGPGGSTANQLGGQDQAVANASRSLPIKANGA